MKISFCRTAHVFAFGTYNKGIQHQRQSSLRVALLIAVLGLASPMLAAETPPSAEQVLAVFSEKERAELMRGEIISKVRKEQETAKEALAVTIALWVPGNLQQVAERLHSNSQLLAKQEGTTRQVITGPIKGDGQSGAFRGVEFVAKEQDEIDALLTASPGDKFNLSADEIGLFQKVAGSLGAQRDNAQARAEAVNTAYRRMLENRFLAYRSGGLNALAPYARADGAKTSPGQELAATTEAMTALTRHFPAFFKAYRFYPANQTKSYQHEFAWSRQVEDGRPQYALEHNMTEISDRYALIAMRMFYVGHGLNALQIGILCMPYREGTVVGLANQSFVDQIGRYDNRFVRSIGHKKVTSRVMPTFELLQKQYRGKSAER